MNKAGTIISIKPRYAIPGGEISVACEGLSLERESKLICRIGGESARIIGASSKRILACVPEIIESPDTRVEIQIDGDIGEGEKFQAATMLAGNFHIVANPAVDPNDGSIIVTRSGVRGQQIPVTLFRIHSENVVDEISVHVINPTGLAFNGDGELYVTNRAEGEVIGINEDEDICSSVSGFGIATGIAFDDEDVMYVGDRSGTIYRYENKEVEVFATVEPSVAAFHLAFDREQNLYVSAPRLSSFDSIYKIDRSGEVGIFSRGFGRPQGLAFDTTGNLYVAACLRGRRGIVRVSPDGADKELFVSGMNVVGLCFNREGEMIVATGEAIYNLPLGIRGLLLR
jgi:sugar lactone lactonase YvrE